MSLAECVVRMCVSQCMNGLKVFMYLLETWEKLNGRVCLLLRQSKEVDGDSMLGSTIGETWPGHRGHLEASFRQFSVVVP